MAQTDGDLLKERLKIAIKKIYEEARAKAAEEIYM